MKDSRRTDKELLDVIVQLNNQFTVSIDSKPPHPFERRIKENIMRDIRKALVRLPPDKIELLWKCFDGTLGRNLLSRLLALTGPSASKACEDPPCVAVFFLLLAPKKYREHLLGDLEEEYRTVVLPRFGLRRARFWFWWQVCISLTPLVGQQLKRIAGLAMIWKYIGR
jgi:hypothetical protein